MLLKPFIGEFYLEKNSRFIIAHFWEDSFAEEAMKKIKKSQADIANCTYE